MDTRFQVYFTPLTAVLFAFPSRYLFTIGHRVVFSLGEWSPQIQTEFHVLRPNWDPGRFGQAFGYGAITRYGRAFQLLLLAVPILLSRSRNPAKQASRFRLLRFRSPLLTQSQLISSPSGTEMFHFPEYGLDGLCIHPPIISYERYWVVPFGNPRIKAR